MLTGRIAAAALAGAGLLTGAGSARADDDLMNLKGGAVTAGVTVTLGADGTDADTELVSRRGGGFARGGGGFRGGFVGARGGFRVGGARRGFVGARGGFVSFRGGFVGARGGFVGVRRGFVGFRGGWGGGWGGGFVGNGGGWGPYFGSSFRRVIIVRPSVVPVYVWPSSFSPCSTGVDVTGTRILSAPPGGGFYTDPNFPPAGSTVPQMPRPQDLGAENYQYDGGPQVPVPMPGNGVNPTAAPTRPSATVPLEGRLVSLPGQTQRLSYPAYGERR